MSRLYITASMKHTGLGVSLPVFSVETADHTGGGYHLNGIHPSSLAAMGGRGPEVKRGERFDLKFNINSQRTSLALVVNTTKHLPHLEWLSEGGMGDLPLGMKTIIPLLLANGRSSSKKSETNHEKGEGAASKSNRRSGKGRPNDHSPSRSSKGHRSSRSQKDEPKRIRGPERRREPSRRKDHTYDDYGNTDDGWDDRVNEYAPNESGYGSLEHGVSDRYRREKERAYASEYGYGGERHRKDRGRSRR